MKKQIKRNGRIRLHEGVSYFPRTLTSSKFTKHFKTEDEAAVFLRTYGIVYKDK